MRYRKFREILVIPNLQRLTSVVFIRCLTACHSAIFLQSLLLLTYRDHFLNIARLIQSSAVKTSGETAPGDPACGNCESTLYSCCTLHGGQQNRTEHLYLPE